uniref:Uncharacterized protein n=1 Tax=Podoviridae sp. ctjUd6 TaxID=2825270 RepID=A0A8S5U2U8_9CAUD|nr:MAG TPA: hypothetical protein [Podoviridae sp. ctjUd6]
MSEIRDKVAQFAGDMFKYVVANNSDDPQTVERAAAQLGRSEFENYLITGPHEFLADLDFIVELWHEQDPVKFFLSRKTLDVDALDDLTCGVTHFLDCDAVFREEDASTYLGNVFTRAWKFNPAEVGYLWRLLHDCEFPILPATHSLEHDVIANVASMGALPEEVLDMANRVHDLLKGE